MHGFKGSGRARFLAAFLAGVSTLATTTMFAPHANAATTTVPSVLKAGQTMTCGHFLQSPSGEFRFNVQCDGNLVLRDKGGQVMWNSKTAGKGASKLVVQKSDGNLVLYSTVTGKAIWAPPGNVAVGHPGDSFAMQDDGNAVITAPGNTHPWSTQTSATCEANEVCLYQNTTATGFNNYDTKTTTLPDYSKIKFHNGVTVLGHLGSIRNNTSQRICFWTGKNFTGFYKCENPHTVDTNLGTAINKLSSNKPDPGCVNPFAGIAGRWTPERTDAGVDYGATVAGAPVHAICSGVIISTVGDSSWSGHFIVEKLTSGPWAGKCIYYAEHLTNILPVGTAVTAGQTIAVSQGGTYPSNQTEWGWAAGPGQVVTHGYPSPAGKGFARFLRSLGAPTLEDPGAGPQYDPSWAHC